MPLDLSRKSNLVAAERWSIASDLQAILLDEVCIATHWRQAEGVFHGGTALHLAEASPRWSEDLDFMVAEPELEGLNKKAKRIIDRVRLRMLELLPGSTIDATAKDRGPGPDRMVTWDLRWRHPNRVGKVQVKAEFYAVAPEHIAAYRARPEITLPGMQRSLSAYVQVPDLAAFWGDKVKASATRHDFKWRDAHDLGFISQRFRRLGRVDDTTLLDALLTSTRIYDKQPEDILDGLNRRLGDGTLKRLDEFQENMQNWFDPKTFESALKLGVFATHLADAEAELAYGRNLIEQHILGMNPAPGTP